MWDIKSCGILALLHNILEFHLLGKVNCIHSVQTPGCPSRASQIAAFNHSLEGDSHDAEKPRLRRRYLRRAYMDDWSDGAVLRLRLPDLPAVGVSSFHSFFSGRAFSSSGKSAHSPNWVGDLGPNEAGSFRSDRVL